MRSLHSDPSLSQQLRVRTQSPAGRAAQLLCGCPAAAVQVLQPLQDGHDAILRGEGHVRIGAEVYKLIVQGLRMVSCSNPVLRFESSSVMSPTNACRADVISPHKGWLALLSQLSMSTSQIIDRLLT